MNVDFLNLQRVNASFGDELEAAVQRVVRSGWYLRGDETAAFEREWADYVGAAHCVGCGNGLDALTLVLTAWKLMYQWQDGDEVIVPSNTFIATVLAVSRAGLRPVFCEPHLGDALMNADLLEGLHTERTRALIPVHLYGMRCDMQAINAFADRHALHVLQDACQAHGAVQGGTAAWSFYPGKNLGALGDAGCITTDDALLAQRVRQLGNYGSIVKYVHDFQGCNSRLDELQAAVLRVKLRRLERDNQRRRQIADYYGKAVSSLSYDAAVQEVTAPTAYHIYALRSPHRDALQQHLRQAGIQTLIHYPTPPHKQKAYSTYASLHLPVADAWARTELSLPMSPVMTDDEVEFVAKSLSTFQPL